MTIDYIANDAWFLTLSEIASQWRGVTVKQQSRAWKSGIIMLNGERIGRVWQQPCGTISFDSVSQLRFAWKDSKTMYSAIEQIIDLEVGF